MIDVTWFEEVQCSYTAEIEVFANDRNNLLKDILKQIENSKAKLMGVNGRATKERIAIFELTVETVSSDELNRLMNSLNNVNSVYEVKRKRG